MGHLPTNILLILLLASSACFAQPVLQLSGVAVPSVALDLRPYTATYMNETDSLQSAQVMIQQRFGPFATSRKASSRTTIEYGFRFRFQNMSSSDTLYRLLYVGRHLLLDYYLILADKMILLHRTGWLTQTALPQWASNGDHFTMPVVLPPSQSLTLFVKSTDYMVLRPTQPLLFTNNQYGLFLAQQIHQNRFASAFLLLVIGVCLFLSLTGLCQFAVTADSVYGWWAVYLLCIGLYFTRTYELRDNVKLVSSVFPYFVLRGTYLLSYIAQIAYVLFLSAFLQLPITLPKFYNFLRLYVTYLLAWLVLSFGMVILLPNLPRWLTLTLSIANYGLLFAVCGYLFWERSSSARLLLIGSLGSVTGIIIGSIIDNSQGSYLGSLTTSGLSPLFVGIGILFELLCFQIALSSRIRQVEREKQQLKAEKRLTIQRLTSQFQQRLAETEMAALRAQMNPHFIFNCLNSIQYFTAQNQADKASDYLIKFSRLIRLVLENSRSEKVKLANELETLMLYLVMESMRFPGKLNYAIEVSDEVDSDTIELPPLLLQPFVENAIWHGLMHKEMGGTVQVKVQQPTPKQLRIEISDDGIGRAKATEFKSKSATQHKSFGLKLTTDRIELINQLYQTNSRVSVQDMVDTHGQPAGTNVVIDIPI